MPSIRTSARSSINSGRRLRAPKAAPEPKPLLKWLFWLVVFSVSFENLNTGFGAFVSLPKIVGYFFFVVALTQPGVCFRSLPRAFWCFGIYLVLCLVEGIPMEETYRTAVMVELLTQCQLLMLFWISYNLMRSDSVVRGTVYALVISSSVFALLPFFGLGVDSVAVIGGDRIKTLGTNPNAVGAHFALGILALIGVLYGRRKPGSRWGLLVVPVFLLLATQLVRTGSRAPALSLMVGLLAFLAGPGTRWDRIRRALIVLLAFGAFVGFASQSELFQTRWALAVNQGSLAGREKIFPAAWQMFLDRPLFGWGPVRNLVELGLRLGRPNVPLYSPYFFYLSVVDTHNLYLSVLTETGLLGAVPFFLGLGLCLHGAWKARGGLQGTLPLALLLAILTVNSADNLQLRKLLWLVLAYALAAGSHFAAERRQELPASADRSSVRRISVVPGPVVERSHARIKTGCDC